ncbi:MAG: small ribosomal subunit protein bS21 [Planctomycetota bacterium]
MLRRFKKLCEKEGLTKEIKRRKNPRNVVVGLSGRPCSARCGPRKGFGGSEQVSGASTKQALAVRSIPTCWVTLDLLPGAVGARGR